MPVKLFLPTPTLNTAAVSHPQKLGVVNRTTPIRGWFKYKVGLYDFDEHHPLEYVLGVVKWFHSLH